MKFTVRLSDEDEDLLQEYRALSGGTRGKNDAIRQAIRDAIRYHRLVDFITSKIKRMVILTQDDIDDMEEITMEL